MAAYYNEHDPFAAAWLRELIKGGLIAPGDVDERSIEDVAPNDLNGYTQCHFFAGIGGWSYALRLADWPDDRPVWTGSCPCQPFSTAGKGAGFIDERHLWPSLFHLIEQCRPVVVFGEQVASKPGLAWLDLVQSDLEGAGYAVGAADLCAAGVGAPHIRQRLWFVAESDSFASEQRRQVRGWRDTRSDAEAWRGPCGDGQSSDLGDTERTGLAQRERDRDFQLEAMESSTRETIECSSHPWANAVWLPCSDGKSRPVEPSIFPLAHGIPNRVGLLRGAGNAIVPEVAAAFITACSFAQG